MRSLKITIGDDVNVTFFEMATDTGLMLITESKKNSQVMIIVTIKIMIMLIILMMVMVRIMMTMMMMMTILYYASHLTASSEEDRVRIDGCLAACTTSESLRCFSLSCLPLIALYTQYMIIETMVVYMIVMMLIMILMIKMMIEITDLSLYKSPISLHHKVPLSYSPIQ